MENEHASILLVDGDEAFATMLQQSLEQGSDYHATVATSGDGALQALNSAKFDLAIVDLGLTDPDGPAVARMLRQQQAELRLILIPLVGEELPPELADLDVHGVLPKPFFLPELPRRIADAMAEPKSESPSTAEARDSARVAEPDVAPARIPEAPARAPQVPMRTSEVRTRIPDKRMPKITRAMNTLSQEVNAEAVILTAGGELIAHTGRLSAEGADSLAQAVGESWHTSARVARILSREQQHFEQSVEGDEHMFYSLTVREDIVLSVALRTSVPLGMIRHRAKATAEALRNLVAVT